MGRSQSWFLDPEAMSPRSSSPMVEIVSFVGGVVVEVVAITDSGEIV